MEPNHPQVVELDDDDDDEFKPLYDYSDTVVPLSPVRILSSSDESDEDIAVLKSGLHKRKLDVTSPKKPITPTLERDEAQKTILDDDDDDDDDDSWWMPSPSKLLKLSSPAAFLAASPALQQLRLRRQELVMLQQKVSPEAIQRVEEQARVQAQQRPEAEKTPTPTRMMNNSSHHHHPHSHHQGGGSSSGSECAAASEKEKEKILLKVQNNTQRTQSIRIFTTDKFEKLFRVYSEMTKLPLESMVFRFDGDQISPTSSPKELDMEEGDIIEVYIRS